MKNSKEALKKQADARFKKNERVREGTKAMLEYEAEFAPFAKKLHA